MMMKKIRSMDDLKAAFNEGSLIVLMFKVSWCPSCKAMGPVFDELCKKHSDVLFCLIDIEEAQDVRAEFGIQRVPTFIFYKHGNKVAEFTGANRNALEENIQGLK
ncbi:thioredoxin-like [Discoglossus pictus]